MPIDTFKSPSKRFSALWNAPLPDRELKEEKKTENLVSAFCLFSMHAHSLSDTVCL